MPLSGIVGGRPIGATCEVCGLSAPYAIGFSARRETHGLWYCREHLGAAMPRMSQDVAPVEAATAVAQASLL